MLSWINMLALLAAIPILTVIAVMLFLRWSGQRAGFLGLLLSIIIGYAQFGLNSHVFWFSQVKGLYLSFFVLAIVWPALLLYQVVRRIGGVRAVADALQSTMQARDLLLVGLAWAFSGALEGLAGFGLPIAVVAPMLVGLGVQPVLAVAATAIGHSWSITFGDMGVIFQTLLKLTEADPAILIPPAAMMLGLACLVCGWCAMLILGQAHAWYKVTLIALAMGLAQYALSTVGLVPLSAFGAGVFGMALLALWSRPKRAAISDPRALRDTALSYGGLTVLMVLLTAVPSISAFLSRFNLVFYFPEVSTSLGFTTPAATQSLRYFLHPGFSLIVVAVLSMLFYHTTGILAPGSLRLVAADTIRSAVPTSLGVLFMVGLSSLMEHAGMMHILAQALSRWVGAAFPLVSPWIGMLGAFATGSNNNSNVMFAVLQQNAASLLDLDRGVIIAAQTTGGALGSMIAPAKLILGCVTAGISDQQGEVLRRTLPYGLGIGLVLGVIAYIFS